MKARTYLSAVAALASIGLSCGGGSTKQLTPDDFCSMKATTECQVVARCVSVPMAACVSARTAVCNTFKASAATLPRVFTPGNVGNCIGKTNAAYSKATITPADLQAMDDACNYVYQGNVAKSSTCTVKFDCAGATDGSIICDKTLCASRVVKNLNDLCGNPGEVCNTGSYCTSDGAVMRCLPKKMAADACDPATAPCMEALRCTAAVCMTRIAMGGDCTSNDDCVSTAPYCDQFAGNKCAAGLTFASGSPSCAAYGGSATGTGGTGGTTGDAGGTGGTGGADASAGGG